MCEKDTEPGVMSPKLCNLHQTPWRLGSSYFLPMPSSKKKEKEKEIWADQIR